MKGLITCDGGEQVASEQQNNNLFEADKEGRRGALDTWSWEFRGTIVIHSMLCDLCRRQILSSALATDYD